MNHSYFHEFLKRECSDLKPALWADANSTPWG
jgi:hypothetical protein